MGKNIAKNSIVGLSNIIPTLSVITQGIIHQNLFIGMLFC